MAYVDVELRFEVRVLVDVAVVVVPLDDDDSIRLEVLGVGEAVGELTKWLLLGEARDDEELLRLDEDEELLDDDADLVCFFLGRYL